MYTGIYPYWALLRWLCNLGSAKRILKSKENQYEVLIDAYTAEIKSEKKKLVTCKDGAKVVQSEYTGSEEIVQRECRDSVQILLR